MCDEDGREKKGARDVKKETLHEIRRQVFFSGAIALLVTLLTGAGLLRYADSLAGDLLYQRGSDPNENIVVIGIDSYALEELGPWPWSRDVMGDILYTLNADPACRSAAIGVDVLYAGTSDPAADAWLADAASADNVVLACSVEFGDTLEVDGSGAGHMNEYGVQAVNLPFDALYENTQVGHTNAMYDRDGVLRHHIWAVYDEEGTEYPSLPYKLYELFCRSRGMEADFAPQLSGYGFWWVDYGAGPGDYYTYSAADILYGQYDPELLADAIVLIGPYDPGLMDYYLTPKARAEQMYGVEYLANVVDAMLRGAEKQELSDGLQLAALFALVFVLLLLCQKIKLLYGGILCVCAALCCLGLGLLLYQRGIIVHPLWGPVGAAATLSASVVLHYVRVLLDRRRIISTFQRYEDPAVIKELLRVGITDADLRGKTTEVAVLFVDIRGFTTMSEKVHPTEVVEILNQYLTLTSKAVHHNGGTLDKFIGDCTMAFWGAPLPCEDKVYKACQAAMEMVQGVTALEEEMQRRFGYRISFGVGVHVGPAVIGNIGSPERMDYTAIGDTVNTASRLESNAPAGTIYISRAVADALGERAVVTSLGSSVKLKGKAEGFEVLRLERLETTQTD